MAEDQAGDHDGQHARGVDLLRGEEGCERGDERQRRVEYRLVDHSLPDERQHQGQGDANQDAAAGRDQEVQPDPRHADLMAEGRNRGVQGDQGSGVVDEALALEDGDDPAGETDPPGHCGCGHGVGRGHDRADREGGGQAE